MELKKLTDKQRLFCQYYIEDWHATNAAKKAGYSEKTAYSIGSENLTKPEIQDYIKEIQSNIEQIANISRLKVLNKLKDIAFEDDLTSADSKDQLKAIEVINKMLGYNDPEKFDMTSGGDKIESVQFYLPENNRDN